jgi:hypothetical protein
LRELYPDVVDGLEGKGGVPSRLMKTDRPRGGKGRHAMVDVRRLPVGEENEITVTLDDLAREGARRMIAAALTPRPASTSRRLLTTSMRTASGWWSAMGARVSAS